MTVSVRPRTKLLAALMAAGVVAAASPAVLASEHQVLPELSTVAVQPMSFITDALYGFGDAVYAGTWAIGIPVDAAVSLPFDTAFAVMVSLADPTETASVLSFLAQRYLNPADAYPFYAYPNDFKVSVLETLAGLLPAPTGQAIIDALNNISNVIGGTLASGLPDPAAGADLFDDAQLNTFVGQVLYSAQLGILAPVYALAHAVTWLGYEPAELAATFEAALQTPANLPGLLSNLVYGVLDPDDGLLGQVAWPFVNAGLYAPPPIGWSETDDGLALNAYTAFSTAVNGLLGAVLPTPIVPGTFDPVVESESLAKVAAAPSDEPTTAVVESKTEVPADDAGDPAADAPASTNATHERHSSSRAHGDATEAKTAAPDASADADGAQSAAGKSKAKHRADKAAGSDAGPSASSGRHAKADDGGSDGAGSHGDAAA